MPIPGRVAEDGSTGAPSWWTEDGDGFDAAFARFGRRTRPASTPVSPAEPRSGVEGTDTTPAA